MTNKGRLIEGRATVVSQGSAMRSGLCPFEHSYTDFNFRGTVYTWWNECRAGQGNDVVIRAFVRPDNRTLYRLTFPCGE